MNSQPTSCSLPPALAGKALSVNWLAAYTYPKAEKKVYDTVRQMGLDAFLPLHWVVRQWSDRNKKMEVPLFPNYVFVKVASVRRFDLFRIKELVRFVSCDDQPVVVPEKDINNVRRLLAGDIEVYDNGFNYRVGERVKVVQGQFTGAEGFLVQLNGRKRLVVQLEVLQKLISVEIAAHCVAPVA